MYFGVKSLCDYLNAYTPINRFRLHCNVCLGACLFVLYCTDCIFVLAQFITPVILQWKYHRHTVVDLLERYIHSPNVLYMSHSTSNCTQ